MAAIFISVTNITENIFLISNVIYFSQVIVVHTFNPSTWESEAGRYLEFEASVVYRVSFRAARATQRNPDLKNK